VKDEYCAWVYVCAGPPSRADFPLSGHILSPQ
jgi:hypothetical protein